MKPDNPPQGVIQIGDGFWNLRGSYKVRGLVEIGTHVSLIRLASGKFVFLDSYSLEEPARAFVDQVTRGGADLEAVINLHPFHTVHVREMHARYPQAKHYGTARHVARFGDLDWETDRTEDQALHARYAADLRFSVPRGVDFVSSDENLHFASVLVYHPASRTIHVDDTFLHMRMPKAIRVLKKDVTRLHPSLSGVLQKRRGAARDFRLWMKELLEEWGDAENLCAAHGAALLATRNDGPSVERRLTAALEAVDGKLRAHEKKYG